MEMFIIVTVTDQQGQLLPGAGGTLTSPKMKRSIVQFTAANGQMWFAVSLPGLYDLTVSLEGFVTATISGIETKAGQPKTNVSVTLQVQQP